MPGKWTLGTWRHGKPTKYGTRHPASIEVGEGDNEHTICHVYGIPDNCTLEDLLSDCSPDRLAEPLANLTVMLHAPELYEALEKATEAIRCVIVDCEVLGKTMRRETKKLCDLAHANNESLLARARGEERKTE